MASSIGAGRLRTLEGGPAEADSIVPNTPRYFIAGLIPRSRPWRTGIMPAGTKLRMITPPLSR